MAGGAQHDAILATEASGAPRKQGIAGLVDTVNEAMFKLSAVALVAASLVLTFGVVLGHVIGKALAWQDEVTIFLIAGAIFLSAWHGFLAGARKKLAAGERPKTGKFWRATNELPFIAAVVMVLAVTLQFGQH